MSIHSMTWVETSMLCNRIRTVAELADKDARRCEVAVRVTICQSDLIPFYEALFA